MSVPVQVRAGALARARDFRALEPEPRKDRHTFCSHLADEGRDGEGIRKLAGRPDLTTTQGYTAVRSFPARMHLSPAHDDAAIRLLDPAAGGRRGQRSGRLTTSAESNGR